jgi:tRNA nucleotidyltransferase (CCA-adding enzyme)
MKMYIPLEALAILHTLQQARYQAYIVGGAVRDILRTALHGTQEQSKDYDFTTDATPQQVLALFTEGFYENKFGTVSITPEHLRAQLGLQNPATTEQQTQPTTNRIIDLAAARKIHVSLQSERTAPDSTATATTAVTIPYEITTFRSDGSYTDHRRPETVSWGTSLKEDLDRRDFTINAMALEISQTFLETLFRQNPTNTTIEILPDQYTIHDPHNGQSHLEKHLITTVRNPHERFAEDALRMLRAIRFSVQLNMQIDPATYQALVTHHELLAHISYERIRDEFLKMLTSDFPKEAVELLDETGLLPYIIPELLDAKGVKQGGHHTTDVWTHSLDALAACPSSDPIVRLATLLHDISKPETFALLNGQPTFYNHEILGSRLAKKIARRLRLSNAEVDRIFTLVRFHMFYYQPNHTDAAIRRFMRNVGLENIDDILDLREGDRLGSGARKTSWRLEEMKQRMIEQLNQPLDVTDLAISGTDLMETFHLQPGPRIGKLLHNLFEQVMEDATHNTKEKLLKIAQQELQRQPGSEG